MTKPKTKQANLVLDSELTTWFDAARKHRPEKKTSDRALATAAIKWASTHLDPKALAELVPTQLSLRDELVATKAELAKVRLQFAEATKK